MMSPIKTTKPKTFKIKKESKLEDSVHLLRFFFNQQVKNLFSVDMKQENQNCERPTKNKGNKL